MEYDHEDVPISMDKYSIHGRNILSMDLKYPWVPCNITAATRHFFGGPESKLPFSFRGGLHTDAHAAWIRCMHALLYSWFFFFLFESGAPESVGRTQLARFLPVESK